MIKSLNQKRYTSLPFILLVVLTNILGQEIPVTIHLEKDTYYTAEPIMLEVIIRNNSDHGIMMDAITVSESIIIRDSKGKQWPLKIAVNRIPRAGFEPGQEASYLIGLCSYFGGLELELYFDYLPPENYSVHVEFIPYTGIPLPRDKAFNRDKELAKSNTLYFTISEPIGDEGKVLKSIRGIADYIALAKQGGEAHTSARYEIMRIFDEIAEQYPNSIYAPRILNVSSAMSFYSRDSASVSHTIKISKRLITLYPNSHYAESAISSVVSAHRLKRDYSGVIAFLREVAAGAPGTKAGVRAAELQKNIATLSPVEWLSRNRPKE